MELQLCGDRLFFSLHGKANGVQYKVHGLLCSSLVGNNAVIIEIPDYRQIQHTFFGLDVGDVCHPFGIGLVRVKQIFSFILNYKLLGSMPSVIRKVKNWCYLGV